LSYASPWGNGKSNHPGPFGNITRCPTVCISSTVKELNNIKKEEAAGTLVTSIDLFDEPWSLWIQGEKLSSNVKGNMYNFIHHPEAANT
jgi:hypothetical protein